MKLNFTKYQGTGNDFIMMDNINGEYDGLTISQIQFLCNRKMGVGADGLIKISSYSEFDFEVEYFNADGTQSFCGNGARCAVAFAKELGVIENQTKFLAIDGEHNASYSDGLVRLEMLPVDRVEEIGDDNVLAVIRTQLSEEFPLETGGSIEIFEEEILSKAKPIEH